MATPDTLLALDFGLRRIGVATGNTLTRTAQGISSIPARNGSPNWDDLLELAKTWHPAAWVLGEPLTPDGKETSFSKQIKQFGDKLADKTGLPVFYADERYSSNEAEMLLRESVQKGKRFNKRKVAAKDQLAAELILRAWFDQT